MVTWTCSVAAIWTHPSELNIKLTKKEKNTNDMKQSLASDSVGIQVLLALHCVYWEKSRQAVWVHSKCWRKGQKAHFALQDMTINPLRKWHGLHYKKNHKAYKTLHPHDMFSLFQITIHWHKQLPPNHCKHLSILPPPHCPLIPIFTHCMLCLSACLLTVYPNDHWNEWL